MVALRNYLTWFFPNAVFAVDFAMDNMLGTSQDCCHDNHARSLLMCVGGRGVSHFHMCQRLLYFSYQLVSQIRVVSSTTLIVLWFTWTQKEDVPPFWYMEGIWLSFHFSRKPFWMSTSQHHRSHLRLGKVGEEEQGAIFLVALCIFASARCRWCLIYGVEVLGV